jgi:hypothetical protein
MRNVDPNKNSRLLSEPSKRTASKPMVNPSKLHANLERHIRQILILFGLIKRQQASRAHAMVDSVNL